MLLFEHGLWPRQAIPGIGHEDPSLVERVGMNHMEQVYLGVVNLGQLHDMTENCRIDRRAVHQQENILVYHAPPMRKWWNRAEKRSVR